jgi:hypothetical protein
VEGVGSTNTFAEKLTVSMLGIKTDEAQRKSDGRKASKSQKGRSSELKSLDWSTIQSEPAKPSSRFSDKKGPQPRRKLWKIFLNPRRNHLQNPRMRKLENRRK